MISVTFPDGARREFAAGVTGLDIAKGISPSLAKRTVGEGDVDHGGSVVSLAETNRRKRRRGYTVGGGARQSPRPAATAVGSSPTARR